MAIKGDGLVPEERALDFAMIVKLHGPRVQRVLRRGGVPERDLGDATQEVFLVVHRKLATFEGRASLATWLHRIAANVASEYRRRARHRYESLAHDPEAACGAEDPVLRLEARDALLRARAALEDMEPAQREAMRLYELEGIPMADVAERMGVPLKTAFSRLYAARKELARKVGACGGFAVDPFGRWLSAWRARLHGWLDASASVVPRVAQIQLAGAALAVVALMPSPPRAAPPPSAPSAVVMMPAALLALPREVALPAPPGVNAGSAAEQPMQPARNAKPARLRPRRHVATEQARVSRETPAPALAVRPDALTIVRLSEVQVPSPSRHPWSALGPVDPRSLRPRRMSASEAATAPEIDMPFIARTGTFENEAQIRD